MATRQRYWRESGRPVRRGGVCVFGGVAAVAGVASVAAGALTGSVAPLAFGLDSVIDGSASGVLVWRFELELRRAGRADHAERVAARAVAVAMLAAAYVVAQAAQSLITGVRPRQSAAGLLLLAGSVVVLPVLGCIKLRLAGRLRSRALRGDGVLSAAGACRVPELVWST